MIALVSNHTSAKTYHSTSMTTIPEYRAGSSVLSPRYPIEGKLELRIYQFGHLLHARQVASHGAIKLSIDTGITAECIRNLGCMVNGKPWSTGATPGCNCNHK